MATFMSALLGCKAVDDKAIEPIEEGLKEKYRKEFTVSALGDRIGKDSATAYVYADDDPEMRFIVNINKDGEIIFENYAYRLLCRRTENMVNEAFSENGLISECYVEFSDYKYDIPLETTVNDYIKESGSDTVKAAMIVKADDKLTGEILEKIYTEIYSQMPEITVGFSLYILSARDYDNVYENVKTETQYFGLSRLKLYGIEDDVKELYAEISKGQLSKTVDEMNDKLEVD